MPLRSDTGPILILLTLLLTNKSKKPEEKFNKKLKLLLLCNSGYWIATTIRNGLEIINGEYLENFSVISLAKII